jgi:hypothetical protein
MFLWMLWGCLGTEPVQKPASSVQSATTQAVIPLPVGPGTAHFTSAQMERSTGVAFAIDTLSQVVRDHGRDPANPWAIGHGLVAMGHPLKLTNDSDAVQWLFAHYAERFAIGEEWFIRFPSSKGAVRIEPHTDLILKALVDVGVNPKTAVQVQGQPHTVGDLYRGSLADTWFKADTGLSSYGSNNDIPWSLLGLSSWSSKGMNWTDLDGRRSMLDEVADHTMNVLHTETRFLAEAKANGRTFQKKGQGIFQYTCGGAHLLQGAAHATIRGFGKPENKVHLKEQLHLLMYRFPIELSQIDTGAKQHPKFKLQLRVQRLKLTGHTLETLYRLSATELVGEADRRALEQVTAEVVKSVVLLKELNAFSDAEKIRSQDEQLYLDIVGDSAHALRGLRIAVNESPVFY